MKRAKMSASLMYWPLLQRGEDILGQRREPQRQRLALQPGDGVGPRDILRQWRRRSPFGRRINWPPLLRMQRMDLADTVGEQRQNMLALANHQRLRRLLRRESKRGDRA